MGPGGYSSVEWTSVCVCVYACACIRGKREGEEGGGGVSAAVHFLGSADGRG